MLALSCPATRASLSPSNSKVSSYTIFQDVEHIPCFCHHQCCSADYQALEVDRAIDNLVKSGKLMAGAGRRESMQMGPVGRPFPEFGKDNSRA